MISLNDKKISLFLGWISLVTPWLAVLGVIFYNGIQWPISISSLAYSPAAILLYLPLIVSGILLILYKGRNKLENVLTTVAGFAAIAICIFPCGFSNAEYVNYEFLTDWEGVGLLQLPEQVSGILHNVSTAVFFTTLSVVTCTLLDGTGKKSKQKNILYHVCGMIAIASVYLDVFYILLLYTLLFILSLTLLNCSITLFFSYFKRKLLFSRSMIYCLREVNYFSVEFLYYYISSN